MGNFFLKIFSPVVYIQNEQRVMGIILRYVCWGIPPPPPGARRFGSMGEHLMRRGDSVVLTKQLQLLPLAVLSLVRDILELNYCTKLFHRTVHVLSAQLCKTRRNIGVSRGKHHSNKTAFSIAFFGRIFRIFSAFSRIFCQSRRPHFPPPPPLHSVSVGQHEMEQLFWTFKLNKTQW